MEELETTSTLFNIVEYGHTFEPICSVNQEQGKYLNLYSFWSDDYTRHSDWKRFINRVDDTWGENIFNKFMGRKANNKSPVDIGYCKMQKVNRLAAKIIFKKPIDMVFGQYIHNQETKCITQQINWLCGSLEYEYYWEKGNKTATMIETYIKIEQCGFDETLN